MLGYSYRKSFGSKIAWANRKESDRVGVGPVTKQVVECNDLHGSHGRVCEGDMARVGVSYGMAGYFRAKPFPIWIPQHFFSLVILLWGETSPLCVTNIIKIKRNRSLNTANGLLAKMESTYVTTCFGLHLWPSSGYSLVALSVFIQYLPLSILYKNS